MGQEWSRRVAGDCPERIYTPAETIHFIRELMKLDQQYTQCVENGVYSFLAFRMADMGKSEEVRQAVSNPEYVRMAGSCAEGAAICRWFRTGIPDIELDINYQVGIISAEQEKRILEEIPEKPGFLKIYNSRETYDCLHPLLRRARPELSQQFNTGTSDQTFINTISMQDDISAIWPHMDGDNVIGKISALLMGVDESLIGQILKEEVVGPSNMMELVITLRDEPAIAYSADSVLTLKVEKPPDVFKPSLERIQKFLSPALMQELRQAYTEIVPKKSPGATTEEEWRRSTTHLEHILMKTWKEDGNDQKMVCYFTLKSLYYRYIRGIVVQDKYISSYAVKTEMLWLVEELPPSEWTDANFLKNIKRVFQLLLDDLKRGNIKNYFIPEMNVIDHQEYSDKLIREVIVKLEELTNHLEAFMPCDLEKMVKQGEAIVSGMNAILIIIKYMKTKADLKRSRTRQDPLAGAAEFIQMLDGAGVNVPHFLQGFFK